MENRQGNLFVMNKIIVHVLIITSMLGHSAAKYSNEEEVCPKDWIQAGSQCYHVIKFDDPLAARGQYRHTTAAPSSDRSWKKARLNCMMLGSDLVSINSAVENKKIDMVKKMSGLEDTRYYWVGLYDAHTEGRFRWVDGSNVTFSNWKVGEPSSFIPTSARGRSEDYVVASGRNRWMDVAVDWTRYIDGCQEPSAYICEKPVLQAQDDKASHYSVGLAKILGLIGSIEATGQYEIKGQHGPPGPKGEQGIQGQKGSSGINGKQGRPGPKGDPGTAGATGPEGATGPPGMIQVMDTLIGPDGAKGDKGNTGSTGLPGPTGPRGFKGDRGQVGQIGRTGAKGPKGKQGDKGNLGQKGDKGSLGPQGMKGTRGTDGQTGSQGLIGPIGPAGPKGNKGNMGNVGLTGGKGDRGTTGPMGPRGPLGIQGRTGVTGSKGRKGEGGRKGEVGEKGSEGQQGLRGFLGPIGPKGERGDRGIQGVAGSTGLKGQRGADGLNGLPGMNGMDGPEGSKGDTGGNGPQGDVGPPGPPGPVPNIEFLPGEDDNNNRRGNNRPIYVNATAYCSGRASGAYVHPLHCWQFITCGVTFGGDKEHTCYAGRRFMQAGPECKEDDTCVFGAPSVQNEDPSNEIRLAALAMKEGEQHFAQRATVDKLKASHSIYSAGMVVIFVLLAALAALVSRLYLNSSTRAPSMITVGKQSSRTPSSPSTIF